HLRPRMIGEPRAQAREMARTFMAQLPQAEREASFYGELQSYIRTDPELREQQAGQQKAQFDWMAGELEATFGERLAYPARVVAKRPDEGSLWRSPSSVNNSARESLQPLIRPAARATFSRKGRRTTRLIVSSPKALSAAAAAGWGRGAGGRLRRRSWSAA